MVETRSGAAFHERLRVSANGTVTLQGDLLIPNDPTLANHAARKSYVDSQFTARRLPVVTTAAPTSLILATHNARLVCANAGTTLWINWTAAGDGFSCQVVNRTASALGISMTGFSGTTPTNPDGHTRIRPGGLATLLVFSPDGGTTRLLMLSGASAP